ncbi:hypothetical protein C8T65DRAFT_671551 [Cerioporus squamosus]|nr:hypothetical protein C8T65DRAFT_671551 [Cerioporus squamosus]
MEDGFRHNLPLPDPQCLAPLVAVPHDSSFIRSHRTAAEGLLARHGSHRRGREVAWTLAPLFNNATRLHAVARYHSSVDAHIVNRAV